MFYRLIAIMLGRLRMPIGECLLKYEEMGPKIFAKTHRRRWLQKFLDVKYYKWSADGLEKAVKDPVKEKTPQIPNLHEPEARTQFSNIKSPPDLCKV